MSSVSEKGPGRGQFRRMEAPPATRRLILRETAVSVAINAVLSAAFFIGVFGLAQPVTLGRIAADFLPQSFMVALMGSLVPGLVVGRRLGVPVRSVVVRACIAAGLALLLAGGSGYLLCAGRGELWPAANALLLKVAFGAALAAIVTPATLGRILAAPR